MCKLQLGNVHTLNLDNCKKNTDVSMLGNVYELSLCDCEITDISALGNVHTLILPYHLIKNDAYRL